MHHLRRLKSGPVRSGAAMFLTTNWLPHENAMLAHPWQAADGRQLALGREALAGFEALEQRNRSPATAPIAREGGRSPGARDTHRGMKARVRRADDLIALFPNASGASAARLSLRRKAAASCRCSFLVQPRRIVDHRRSACSGGVAAVGDGAAGCPDRERPGWAEPPPVQPGLMHSSAGLPTYRDS